MTIERVPFVARNVVTTVADRAMLLAAATDGYPCVVLATMIHADGAMATHIAAFAASEGLGVLIAESLDAKLNDFGPRALKHLRSPESGSPVVAVKHGATPAADLHRAFNEWGGDGE